MQRKWFLRSRVHEIETPTSMKRSYAMRANRQNNQRIINALLLFVSLITCVVTLQTAPASAAMLPGAPTIGVAISGNGQASVSFTAPTITGDSAITGYTVT